MEIREAPLQENGAPDLVRGLGRLEFREVENNELEVEVTGPTPGRPVNVAIRLMAQAARPRAASASALTNRKIRRARKPSARYRSLSYYQLVIN